MSSSTSSLSPKLIAAIVVALAVLFIVYSSVFTVDERHQALVLQLGKPKKVETHAGLHLKLPFIQNVVYIDKRILNIDSPAQEVIAADQKRLVVDAFGRFKIIDPLQYYRAVGSSDPSLARQRLEILLNSSVRKFLAEETFVTIVRDNRAEVMRRIRDQVNLETQPFGIEMVDIKIKRTDLPEANSQAIYRRMQTEREQEAAQIRAEGNEQSDRMRAEADRRGVVIVAEANEESEKRRGQGDALRNKIFAEAYSKDREFFSFYRSMLAYETGLTPNATTMVINPNTDFFRFFGRSHGPKPSDSQ